MSHHDPHRNGPDDGPEHSPDHSPDAAHGAAHDAARDHERAEQRAGSVAEEERAGADDPEAQSEAVLAESDERTEDPAGTRADYTQTPGTDDLDAPPSDTTRLNS